MKYRYLIIITLSLIHLHNIHPAALSRHEKKVGVSIQDLIDQEKINANIVDLNISDILIKPQVLTSLEGIEQLKQLEKLNAKNQGLRAIKNITFPKNLRLLNLVNNKITSIKQVQFPDSLQELYLDENRLKRLKNLPSHVKVVGLNSNKFKSLAHISLPKDLEELYLNANEQLKDLGNIASLENLKTLSLIATRIPLEQIEELRKSRPNLRIRHSIIDESDEE